MKQIQHHGRTVGKFPFTCNLTVRELENCPFILDLPYLISRGMKSMFSDDSARVGTYDTFYGYGTVGTVGTVRWGTVRWVRWVRYGTGGTLGTVRWVRWVRYGRCGGGTVGTDNVTL